MTCPCHDKEAVADNGKRPAVCCFCLCFHASATSAVAARSMNYTFSVGLIVIARDGEIISADGCATASLLRCRKSSSKSWRPWWTIQEGDSFRSVISGADRGLLLGKTCCTSLYCGFSEKRVWREMSTSGIGPYMLMAAEESDKKGVR